MHVVIVGAGNLGLVCAARMSAKGLAVTMLTGAPEKWSSVAVADDCNGNRFEGRISVSADPSCVSTADLVVLCLPGNAIEAKLTLIVSHLRQDTPILSIFSGDGFFFIAEKILGVSCPVLGFQRVPFIARTEVPYQQGRILGYKKELFLAHRNIQNPEFWRQFAERFCDTRTVLIDNFYEAALVNSNAVLHPARLMSLRKQMDEYGPFKRIPLFYEEWDDVASGYAVRLDAELRAVAEAKGAHLVPFLTYYDSTDIVSLTRKIRSIDAFKGIKSPLTRDGQIDCSSRYVQADVLISVKSIVDLSLELGLNVPCAREILEKGWTSCAI